MHFTECPHGGYDEKLDMTAEPWATLAPMCWDSPSAYRMGWEAEAHGIAGNPYTSPFARGVFESGRECCRERRLSATKTLPSSKTPNGCDDCTDYDDGECERCRAETATGAQLGITAKAKGPRSGPA